MPKRWMRLAIAAPVTAVVLATAGTWVYFNVVQDDAPERLSLNTGAGSSGTAASTTPGRAAATTGSTEVAASASDIDGAWKVAAGSQAGYRVKELLFGQSAEAVGRTDDVSGQIAIEGTNVTSGSFTVDMTTVASGQSRRDNAFRTRIMDVSTYPTSTFELTRPIALASLPADGTEVKVKATGDLTLRGTTRTVTIDLAAQRAGSEIKVAGSVPIVFADWAIPNPSFGPAQTEDNGELEFLLVMGR